MKVSSRDYSSIYARMPKNIDEYSVFAYSQRIDVHADPALKFSSSHYSLIYVRLSEKVDEYLVFASSRLFSEN